MSRTYRNPIYRSELAYEDSKVSKTEVNRYDRRSVRQSLNLDVTLYNDYTDRFEPEKAERDWDSLAPNFDGVAVPTFFLGV